MHLFLPGLTEDYQIQHGYVRYVRSHYWEFENILINSQPKSGHQRVKKATKIPFLVLFQPSELHLTQITTNTDAKVDKHATCVNALINLSSKFYYCFQGVTYVKNIHSEPLITLFRGLQFVSSSNSYSKSNYTFKKQRKSNNLTLNNVNISYKIFFIVCFYSNLLSSSSPMVDHHQVQYCDN